MDSNGRLYEDLSEDAFGKISRQVGKPLTPLTEEQVKELRTMGADSRKGFMRNQPCVCGSGVKFKRCCWSKYQ